MDGYPQLVVKEVRDENAHLKEEIEALQRRHDLQLEQIHQHLMNGDSQAVTNYLPFCIESNSKRKRTDEKVVENPNPKRIEDSKLTEFCPKSEATFKDEFLAAVVKMGSLYQIQAMTFTDSDD